MIIALQAEPFYEPSSSIKKDKMSKPIFQLTGRNPQFNNPYYRVETEDPVLRLCTGGRTWQPAAFQQLKDERFALLAAFCGSGKSILQIILGGYDVVCNDWKQKQLITIPQSHIADSFAGKEDERHLRIEVEGVEYDWIPNNFCDTKPQVLDRLQEWLLTDAGDMANKYRGDKTRIEGVVAVSTHQALGLVWNRLTSRERAKATHRITVRTDEAHHINGVYHCAKDEYNEMERLAIEAEATTLGDVAHYIFNSSDKNSKLHLSTATPYRHYGLWLSQAVQKDFRNGIYCLDWIEHFQTLGIEQFVFEFTEYDQNPVADVVADIANELK